VSVRLLRGPVAGARDTLLRGTPEENCGPCNWLSYQEKWAKYTIRSVD